MITTQERFRLLVKLVSDIRALEIEPIEVAACAEYLKLYADAQQLANDTESPGFVSEVIAEQRDYALNARADEIVKDYYSTVRLVGEMDPTFGITIFPQGNAKEACNGSIQFSQRRCEQEIKDRTETLKRRAANNAVGILAVLKIANEVSSPPPMIQDFINKLEGRTI